MRFIVFCCKLIFLVILVYLFIRLIMRFHSRHWEFLTSHENAFYILLQRHVLGPLLFLIYINVIVENLSSEIRLFADDCILYRQIKLPADNLAMQKDIDTLRYWSLQWQMNFNSVTPCAS